MIDGQDELPIKQQAKLLKLARSSVYYQPVPLPASDLKLMPRIDRLHLAHPFAGSRMLRDLLKGEGFKVGRCHVRTLMKRMGIEALYRRPRTSKPGAGHRIYPYLLANRQIDQADQVWATDITYVPMARGFVYLVAIMDWHSRRVLSWRLSNTLTTDFCVEALEEALRRYGHPQIFNTDQGSQFTSDEFTQVLKDRDIQISMDGKGAWRDNVFVERLWRSVKYEEIYLHAYEAMADVRTGLRSYFDFYNRQRPHDGLNRQTPDQVYFDSKNELRTA